MEYRPLKITVMSAEGLKNIQLVGKMDLYAEVSLVGYPQSMKKTFVDKNCGSNPKWNFKMELIVDEPYLTKPGLSLLIRIKDQGTFADKEVGSVTIPVHDLFTPNYADDRVVEYQVHTSSGKPKGTLKLSYKFGEKFTPPAPEAKLPANEPMMAYPPAPYPAPGGYHAPPQGFGYAAPQYAQPAYGQSSGYGYPQQAGYGYPPAGYSPYAQQPPQNPKKNKMGGMGGVGLGLGAGLLGGLLVGEMASGIGDAAEYSSGYDDAMDDMGF